MPSTTVLQARNHTAKEGNGDPIDSGRKDELVLQKMQKRQRLKDAITQSFDLRSNIAKYGAFTTEQIKNNNRDGWPMVDYRKKPGKHVEPPYAPQYIKDGQAHQNDHQSQDTNDEISQGGTKWSRVVLIGGIVGVAILAVVVLSYAPTTGGSPLSGLLGGGGKGVGGVASALPKISGNLNIGA